MNKIYKSIYNEVLGTWVAISEVAKSGGKKSKSRMMSSVAVGLVMACAGVAGEAWGQTTGPNYQSGSGSIAQGGNSTAVGIDNKARQAKTTAIGNSNEVNGSDSLAIGTLNIVKDERSSAIGIANYNEGKQTYTYGFLNYGIGIHGTAIGNYNFAVGLNSNVFGDESYAGDITKFDLIRNKNIGEHSKKSGTLNRLNTLIGTLKRAYNIAGVEFARNGLAVGQYSFAFNNYSIAIGNSTISSGDKSLSLGNSAVSLNTNDIAIGTNALAGFSDLNVNEITYGNGNKLKVENGLLGKNARFNDTKIAHRNKLNNEQVMAVESVAKATGNSNPSLNGGASSQIAIGEDTIAMGKQVLAVGATNRAFGTNSSAVGKGNFSHGDAAQAFGNWNISSGSNTIAVGNRNDSTGTKSIAAGFENRAYGEHSTAVGYQNQSEAGHSTAVGHSNKVIGGSYSNAFGFKNDVSGQGSSAVGNHNTLSGSSSIAFGSGNVISGTYSISIGSGAITGTHESSVVNDKSTVTGSYSISIGHQNSIDSDKTVALGNSIISNRVSNSVILGDWSKGINSEEFSNPITVKFGGKTELLIVSTNWAGPSKVSNGSVSIGDSGKERQLKHVATGAVSSSSTDAINGSQLFSSIQAIGNVPLIFKGDDSTLLLDRKLGHIVTFHGGAEESKLSENNISVRVKDEQLDIKLTKELKGITSLETNDGSKFSDNGLEIANGPKITKNGIDANNQNISNVGEGQSDNDAANMKNVSDAINNLRNQGYTLFGDGNTSQNFAIGSSININGDSNVITAINNTGVNITLKKSLSDINSIAFNNGASLNGTELNFAENAKFGSDGLTSGTVNINPTTNRISGLANPDGNSDAVNLGYLKQKLYELPPGKFNIDGNVGGPSEFTLGSTLKVKGTAEFSETDVGENLATQVNNGEILIGLKKALSGLTSVGLENGTTIDNNGLTIDGNTKFGPEGAKVGGIVIDPSGTITGLTDPTADNQAANKGFVNNEISKAVEGLKTGGIKFNGNEGEFTTALGEAVNIKGSSSFSETDEGRNIATKSEGDTVIVGLNKNLTGLDSAQIGAATINDEGLKVTNGPSVTKDGINANNTKIQNVEKGSEDTDAANMLNVKEAVANAVSGLTSGGIKFAGNEGGDKTLALGQKIEIVGKDGSNFTNTDLGENIATKSEEGKITIGLKKQITGLESAVIGGNTIDGEGFKVDGGPTVTKEGIDAKDKKISNVLADENSDENDAANVKFVKDKVEALKVEGYTLSDDTATTQKFAVGETIAFNGDDNITTEVTSDGVKIKLKQDLTNMNSVDIKDGPTLNSDGLTFDDHTKFTKDLVKVGGVQIKSDGTISGLADPKENDHAANKGYVDTQVEGLEGKLSNLQNNPLKFVGNEGEVDKKLGESISIKGDDNSTNKEEFDLTNVMTWFDNGVLRIGVRKALKLSTIKADDGQGKSAELKPNSLVFNGVDGKQGADGTVTLDVTTNGTADVTGAATPRLKINDVDIATLNDGMKFAANAGDTQNVKLNNKVTVKGADDNTNEADFDGGENIMTKVEQDGEGVKFTVAFKKAPEFADLTVGGPKAGDKTPHITLKDKENNEKFFASVDDEGNGIVSVTGSDPENKTDLMHDGLSINDADGFSKLGTNADGKGGLASPDTNKRRMTHTYNDASNNVVTEEIATLDDGLKFEANAADGNGNAKLNSKVKIAGADENKEWSEFDEGANIMTKVENTPDGETVIRVAMRKDLKLKNGSFGGDGADGLVSIKKEDGKDGITIDPSVIHFNNIPNKPDADGNPQNNGAAGITMTQNGTPDLKNTEPATRIQITDASGNPTAEVATMNDGLRFTANVGDEKANTLNSKVSVAGHKKNTEWDKFDTGSNIMTKIDQNEDGETEITVALKRDVELSSAVIGHGEIPAADGNPAVKGKDGQITLNNKEGETAITINAGNAPATSGPSISVNKPRSDEGTKLTSDGIEISKKSPTASKLTKTLVSIAPEGSGRVQDADNVKKSRLTMTSGEGADAKVEEIATMNDGLRFKGDTADLLNKPLSNTLTLIGGESDAKKLTSLEDQNIGVIAEDVAPKGSRAPAEKVLTVRMSKNLKGLQSAEFKPVDESGNATGQSINIGAGGVNIAKGDKSVQLNEDGLKVGENGPSVTNEGINAGGMSIANVGAPMQSNHAANKGYVDGELAKMQGQLGNKIQETRKDALGASAMAMATAGLPQAYKPGKSAFAVAGGVVAGQSAFAMGISSISDNGKWIIKGSVSSDSRSQVGGSIGAAYQW